jgi:hypothetical protein
LQAFVQAVRAQGEAPIPFDSLVSTTLASFQIEASLHSGQPVAIEMDAVQPANPA